MPFRAKKPGLSSSNVYGSEPSLSSAFHSTSASASTSEGESRESQTTSNSGWESETPRKLSNSCPVWGKQPLALLQFSSKEDSPKAKLGGALKEVTGGAVKNTFLEFKAAPEHDFFPEMEDAALLPPRLVQS